MTDNQPTRKYFATDLLVKYLLKGVTGFWGGLLSFLLVPLFNWLAKKGVYFIDVSTVNIRTNMDLKNWNKVAGDVWEQVDAGGLTPEEGRVIDAKFKAAFDRFTVFKRVKRS